MTRRSSAWHGTAPAMAPMARSGAASFCSIDAAAASRGRLRCAHFACPAATWPPASRAAARSAALRTLRRRLAARRVSISPTRELDILLTRSNAGINAPLTSSMGRLFDAVAALIGLRQRCSFEGQAAMALEFAQHPVETDECYPFEITPVTSDEGSCECMIDWKPMSQRCSKNATLGVISAKFHNTLAAMIVTVAEQVGEPIVVAQRRLFPEPGAAGTSHPPASKRGFHTVLAAANPAERRRDRAGTDCGSEQGK